MWEYTVRRIGMWDLPNDEGDKNAVDCLNRMAKDGWEFITCDEAAAFFRRKLV